MKRLSEGNLLSVARGGTAASAGDDSSEHAFQRRSTAPISPLLSKKLSAHIMILKSVVSSDDLVESSRHRNTAVGQETPSPDQSNRARLEKKLKNGKKSKKHKHRKHGKHRHRRSKSSKHTVDEDSPHLVGSAASQDAEAEDEGSEASETGIEMQPMKARNQQHSHPKTNTSARTAAEQSQHHQTSDTPLPSHSVGATIKHREGAKARNRRVKSGNEATESCCTVLCALERHRIRQQNLPGWRLIFTPQLCAIVILLSAVVVGIIGVAVAVASGNIVAHELFYNDSDAHLYQGKYTHICAETRRDVACSLACLLELLFLIG